MLFDQQVSIAVARRTGLPMAAPHDAKRNEQHQDRPKGH
jgi:hypothetical protein